MIESATNSGALPVVERALQFASARHELLAHNIANLSTPGFRPVDVSVTDFRHQLSKAIDSRRVEGNTFQMQSSREIKVHQDRLELHPRTAGNHNVERLMQDMVENFMSYRVAAQFMRSRFDLLQSAIRERT